MFKPSMEDKACDRQTDHITKHTVKMPFFPNSVVTE
jgi:hypothetical protein